ncbi:hypothetical protein COO60DRAFT_1497326 [Scenedesmus sp. NREL 46B-D3]|nr:hypothetical protein COO60DRAFT_1497326 [Scenedesmus sp. NREL 46B-D3]
MCALCVSCWWPLLSVAPQPLWLAAGPAPRCLTRTWSTLLASAGSRPGRPRSEESKVLGSNPEHSDSNRGSSGRRGRRAGDGVTVRLVAGVLLLQPADCVVVAGHALRVNAKHAVALVALVGVGDEEHTWPSEAGTHLVSIPANKRSEAANNPSGHARQPQPGQLAPNVSHRQVVPVVKLKKRSIRAGRLLGRVCNNQPAPLPVG